MAAIRFLPVFALQFEAVVDLNAQHVVRAVTCELHLNAFLQGDVEFDRGDDGANKRQDTIDAGGHILVDVSRQPDGHDAVTRREDDDRDLKVLLLLRQNEVIRLVNFAE